jgi:hypothetical protein
MTATRGEPEVIAQYLVLQPCGSASNQQHYSAHSGLPRGESRQRALDTSRPAFQNTNSGMSTGRNFSRALARKVKPKPGFIGRALCRRVGCRRARRRAPTSSARSLASLRECGSWAKPWRSGWRTQRAPRCLRREVRAAHRVPRSTPRCAGSPLSRRHAPRRVGQCRRRDGTTHLVPSPLEFMQRLAALVTRLRPVISSSWF